MTVPVLTIANRVPDRTKEPYYRMDAFLASAKRQNIEPLFLPGVYKGLMSKPRLLLDYLLKEGANFQHVVVCDAFDILLLTTVDELMYNFKGINQPIVMNAERNCYPRSDLADLFPVPPSPFRFLNSGFMIGETAAVISMLEKMRDQWGFPDDVKKADGKWETPNDQEFYSHYYLQNPGKVWLDHSAILCQSLHGAEDNEFAYLPEARRVISLLTKNQPCAFHGNGNGKKWLERIILWLNL